MSPAQISAPSFDEVSSWCREHLGADPVDVLFAEQHLSFVQGLRLSDGREVVFKLRHAAPRIAAGVEVQRFMWREGFAAPEPLAGPAPLGTLSATAEAYLPGGTSLPLDGDAPRLSAGALCAFMGVASRFGGEVDFSPALPWLGWEHAEPGLWPQPDDLDVDLNADHEHPFLDEIGRRVRERLRRDAGKKFIGHGDWWEPNLRWHEGRLHAVFDWDSVVRLSEAAVAGAAAAEFADQWPAVTTIEQTEAFIDAYEAARGRAWSRDERGVCWAAGLWLMAFNAKKQPHQGVTDTLDHLKLYGAEKLRRAGA